MVHLRFPEKMETSRLVLQRLRYEDAEEIFYCYASKAETTKYLSWPTHRAVEDSRAYVRYAIDAWTMGLDYTFSIREKQTGKFAGSFGVIHEDGRVQFGYVLSPTYWGKGYATEVCQTMMSVLKTFPSVFRIGTFTDSENEASIRVLIKSGLKEEARLKKWMRFVNQNNQPKDCILFYLPIDR